MKNDVKMVKLYAIIFLIICLLGVYFATADKPRDDMCNRNGYYSSDDYYCVWTDGRWEKSIENTDKHESCHALVQKDYEHFCDNNVVKRLKK